MSPQRQPRQRNRPGRLAAAAVIVAAAVAAPAAAQTTPPAKRTAGFNFKSAPPEVVLSALEQMFDTLDDADRLVLQMSFIDGVEQKRIAVMLGVRDYKVTRMKQAAVRQVAKAFYAFASGSGMSDEAVEECVQLILEHFAGGGMAEVIPLPAKLREES